MSYSSRYSGPAVQRMHMTITLLGDQPLVKSLEAGIAVRRPTGKRYEVVTWETVMALLPTLLEECPQAREDVAAMLHPSGEDGRAASLGTTR